MTANPRWLKASLKIQSTIARVIGHTAEPSYLLQQARDSLTQLKHRKMALNPRGLAVDLGTLLSQIPVDPSNLFLSEL